ncbi:MAG TPA: M28 family peptidase [Bacteroidia bacterium]|nr:M28 family peptidase [Bacteroidia bacterium]
MMKKLFTFAFLFVASGACAQVNILSTDSLAEQIMLGNYNPANFISSNPVTHPDSISQNIIADVSADSLKSYLIALGTFHNRNTGSDTVSSVTGVGAARRWVHSKFAEFSAANDNRLIPSYLQFDLAICGSPQHRNIFAVLSGSDTSDKSIIIIEGHMDSRCNVECDTTCLAEGMEDNGSGTVLVIELARVMSRYTFKRTIVFLATIGEEQGLFGSTAFAMYAQQKSIAIKSVLNNDIVGGILCGNTSSPPSCPGFGDVDSMQVRIFSFGNFNSPHKQLARYTKLEYTEQALPYVSVPTTITIMTPEDRTGRGGDHIPFRQRGFASIRFTSANESGNANVADTSYNDRQHTSGDILGVDTNGDFVIDSFFVDFNYLARNAVINGNAAAMAALTTVAPDFQFAVVETGKIIVTITQQTQYPQYRVGVRVLSNNNWDTLYTMNGIVSDTLTLPAGTILYISASAVDSLGIESLFSREYMLNSVSVNEITESKQGITLFPPSPNPSDEATTFTVLVTKNIRYKNAFLKITSASGKEIGRLPVTLLPGINEAVYEHGFNASGNYICSLVVDGKTVASAKLIFAK